VEGGRRADTNSFDSDFRFGIFSWLPKVIVLVTFSDLSFQKTSYFSKGAGKIIKEICWFSGKLVEF
jgi:hypothetical protein